MTNKVGKYLKMSPFDYAQGDNSRKRLGRMTMVKNTR